MFGLVSIVTNSLTQVSTIVSVSAGSVEAGPQGAQVLPSLF